MSEPENFLSRWSRRKLEAEPDKDAPRADDAAQLREPNPSASPRESGEPEPHGNTEPHHETPESAALDSRLRGNERSAGVDDNKEPPLDVSTQPSLESITAETDIRAFLQKGVPAQLTRAALRRAWVADPNIRNFREIAENQWDFATGSDLPGFGSLDADADEIRRMVAEVFGEGPKPEPDAKLARADDHDSLQTAHSAASDSAQATGRQDDNPAVQEQPTQEELPEVAEATIVQRDKVNVAMQQSNPESEYRPLPARRAHGRALPE